MEVFIRGMGLVLFEVPTAIRSIFGDLKVFSALPKTLSAGFVEGLLKLIPTSSILWALTVTSGCGHETLMNHWWSVMKTPWNIRKHGESQRFQPHRLSGAGECSYLSAISALFYRGEMEASNIMKCQKHQAKRNWTRLSQVSKYRIGCFSKLGSPKPMVSLSKTTTELDDFGVGAPTHGNTKCLHLYSSRPRFTMQVARILRAIKITFKIFGMPPYLKSTSPEHRLLILVNKSISF